MMRSRHSSASAHRGLTALALLLVLLLPPMLAACGGDDCTINNTVSTTIGFYLPDGSPCQVVDTLTVSVLREQGDSVVLNRKTMTAGIDIPLGYVSRSDTFVFRYHRLGISDTLFVGHDNHPYFISLDCGAAMFHTLTGAGCTQHVMQSVTITNPEINYDVLENMQIVFAD